MTREPGRAKGGFNPWGLAKWLCNFTDDFTGNFTEVDCLSFERPINSSSGRDSTWMGPLNLSFSCGSAYIFETELNKKENKND